MVGADETTELWRPPYGIVKVNESVKQRCLCCFPRTKFASCLAFIFCQWKTEGCKKNEKTFIISALHYISANCYIFEKAIFTKNDFNTTIIKAILFAMKRSNAQQQQVSAGMVARNGLPTTPNKNFLQVYSELEAIIDKLAKDVQKGTMPRKMLPKPQPLPSANPVALHSNSLSNL